MTRLLLVCLFLTLQVNAPEPRPAAGGWLLHSQNKEWRFYSITPQIANWPFSATGVVPVESGNDPTAVRWFTTQRFFPELLKNRPITLELGNKTSRRRYYVQPATMLVGGVSEFWLSEKFTAVSGFKGVGQPDTIKYHLAVGMTKIPMDSAYYLPEGKWYKVIGRGEIRYLSVDQPINEETPFDLVGLLIDRQSADSDCGSGFYYNGNLLIVVKPVECGLRFNHQQFGQVTLAVPIDYQSR